VPPFLIIQRGPDIGSRCELTDLQVTIGRGPDNDLVLPDALVSRYHAVIRRDGENVVLIDLGSTNPVIVNETVLEPGVPCRLQHRDVVIVGQNVFSFQNPSRTQPSAPAPASTGPQTLVGTSDRSVSGSTAAPYAASTPQAAPPRPETAGPPGAPPTTEEPLPSPASSEPPTVVRRQADAGPPSAPPPSLPEPELTEERPTVITRRPGRAPEGVPPPMTDEPPTRGPGSFSQS
jgi:predicted component of type VI protein secretion system